MSYMQGFVVAVPTRKKQAYKKMAEEAASYFKDYGALRIVECWEDDVPDGKTTDFRQAVKAKEDEKIVFSWIEWPDRKTCKSAAKKMENDPEMQMPEDTPFDGKRMIYGGFKPIVDT